MEMAKAFTEDEFIALGLDTANIPNWSNHQKATQCLRFRENYGCDSKTCAEMWSDFKLLGDIDKSSKPLHLLIALHYLWKNAREQELCQFFGYNSRNAVCHHAKTYTEKIQTLLQLKMLTFTESDDGFIYFMTVDGTHCPIQEPRPFSKIWSSHKFGGDAGVNYEVGLSINKDKLIWLYGPIPAGLKNDLSVAREKLIPKVRQHAHRTLAMAFTRLRM